MDIDNALFIDMVCNHARRHGYVATVIPAPKGVCIQIEDVESGAVWFVTASHREIEKNRECGKESLIRLVKDRIDGKSAILTLESSPIGNPQYGY